jgi:tRNA/rRNA methyltransferase
MMNFGCSDLRLVNPCSGYRSLDARRMALKAESILKHAPVFQTLQQALSPIVTWHSAPPAGSVNTATFF